MPPAQFVLAQSSLYTMIDRPQFVGNFDAVALGGGRTVVNLEISGYRFQFYGGFTLKIREADGNYGPQIGGFRDGLNGDAAIVATGDGGFLFSYTNRLSNPAAGTTAGDVYVTKFRADGTAIFSNVRVNSVADDLFALPSERSKAQEESSVAGLTGGGAVVAFTDKTLDAGDIRFQIIAADGSKLGGERAGNLATSGIQRNSTLTTLANGDFLLTWEDDRGGTGQGFDLLAQRFDASGGRMGDVFTVNTVTAGDQTGATIATLENGNLLIAWASAGTSRFQLFDQTLARVGAEQDTGGAAAMSLAEAFPGGGFTIGGGGSIRSFNTNGTPVGPVTAGPSSAYGYLPDGSFLSFRLEVSGITGYAYIDRYTPSATAGLNIVGTIAAERLVGTAFADTLNGAGGNDVLEGQGGDDVLIGGADVDQLFGGAGDDLLVDASLSTRFDGGDGADTVSYANALAPIVANLVDGTGRFANSPAGDTYVSIENLIGSAFADLLIGDMGANRLDGGGGDDRIITGKGGDVVIGGAGSDTVSYVDSNGTVQVNLSLSRGFNNYADGDSYDGIENVEGSNYLDILFGDGGVNRLEGGLGDDTLIGGLGADVLIGGDGFDIASYEDNQGAVFVNLASGSGYGNAAQGDSYAGIEAVTGTAYGDTLQGDAQARNRLDGGAGDDVLIGGLGARDELVGGTGTDTASYEDNEGAVFVNLASGRGFGNAAEGDYYFGIENVRGSMFGDSLIGDGGVNRLEGSGGSDVLIGGLGGDLLIGGDGLDIASYEDNWGGVFINLLTGRGYGNAAEGDTYQGIEGVYGSAYYDAFVGDNGANRLNGKLGRDTLTGNGGADEFMFDTAIDGSLNVDTITDFAPGTDKIILDRDIFFTLSVGGLGPNNFINGTVATGGQNRIVYDQATGNLWFDDDGNGTDPAILFAVIENKPVLTGADFLVIA